MGLVVSEEMLFENIDRRTTDDGRRMPAYTISSPVSLRLRWANNGKASGPDEISSEIIMGSYDIISPYLVKIFNTLFDNSQYPDEWGLGFIVPIFKGGDPNTAKNYRGITLNNIFGKDLLTSPAKQTNSMDRKIRSDI